MQITDLTKKYGYKTVLNNLSFDIENGKILAVLGGSGEGKTTLLNCIANLVEYDGKITECKPSYVFQTDRLIPNVTVFDNLRYVLDDDKTNELLITYYMQKVGLEDVLYKFPHELSGGMADRVSLVRAFVYNSDTVLMDEPFRSLDMVTKSKMIDFFLSLHAIDKKTTVFVTHNVAEALYLADKIIVLKGGKIIKTLELTSKREDRQLFLPDESLRNELVEVLS